MSMSSHLLERGISFWKNGQKEQARKVFNAIIYNNRQYEAAWIWYIYSLNTNREKIAALETFLNIFPGHAVGKKALDKLKVEPVDQVAMPAEVESVPEKPENLSQVKSMATQKMRPAVRPRAVAISWLLALFGFCFLIVSATIFVSRYNSLKSNYRTLEIQEARISRNFDALNRDFQTLSSEKAALADGYNALVSQYNTLQNDYSLVQGRFEALSSEYSQTIEKYNSLVGEYNRLDTISIKPPYIFIHDRLVQTAFYDTDNQLVYWTTPFSGLEYEIERGYSMRRKIMDQGMYTTTVYTRTGKELPIRNFSVFLTPKPFNDVMSSIYYKSSDPDDFVSRTWNIVRQLSNYASEETETPRYPYETLFAGGGDCEDLSILFASLIKAAPVDWNVDLVYVDADNILNPTKHNHVIVYINTGESTFLVETTSDQDMQPYNDGVVGWLASNLDSRNEEDRQPYYLR